MPTVSQIQMQAVNSPITEAIAQPGSLAGGAAVPAGFDTFLASLNQKMVARLDGRLNSDKSASPKADLGILNMQNLPHFASQAKESAKFTDPMQLLAAQLAAQGLINPALAQPAAASPLLNGGNGVNAIDSTISLSGLNVPNGLGLNGQNIDPQQSRLITQSLAKAMKDAGQANNFGTQNLQVTQLMQMLQQAKPVNAAQASALEQLKGLVTQVAQAPIITLTQDQVNAIRDLAQQSNLPLAPQLASLVNPAAQAAANPAPIITLTPEIASAIRELQQQAKPVNAAQASALEQLKGLVTQVAQAAPQQAPIITLTQDQVNAIRDLAQQSNLPLAPQLASLVNPAAQAAANPAPIITLTPEIASAIRELQQQAKPVNAAQEAIKASTGEMNLVNVAATTTQPVDEKLNTKTLSDRSIGSDGKNVSVFSPQNSNNSDNALTPLFAGQTSKENIGVDNSIRPRPESDYQTSEQEKVADLSAQDANTVSTPNSGLARLDNHTPEAIQKFQIKQTETSLVSGPLHSEIMSAAKSGGGRIMFELTPPEQGTIRIDLRINQSGQAHLIVEGASDATKSRLDQGGQNLKQEFAQMGLNLSLDLRQGNQSQQASGQSFANARQEYYAKQQNIDPAPKTMTSTGFIGSGHNRSASGTVHLFA
ncbi:flagellar hook-length control protein FliK [Polynucleobacter sp. Adler-ghost]|uniref:flagellar hook-length control protein FliK n=1 Tax=Polynucleobacter sp. Adler-ghost TaxID=2770234 RepID=UPI001BFCF044|nr:flagellar hook-length control protein FliK [Polynucleobacter sp. Adler-ghost]QWE31175.1 flagellar hook-length control protein FliK [Polynucleobacter sp. Adler-ghost]